MKFGRKKIPIVMMVILLICSINIYIDSKASGKVQLNQSKITLTVGSNYTLVLKKATSKITWKTSNKSVATISDKGKISAKKVGTATITAKSNNKIYHCKVTVVEVYLNYKNLIMNYGATKTLKLVNAPGKIAWFSSNKNVVYIKDNIVEAKSVGNATITAKCYGKSYTCKITVSSGETKEIKEDGIYTSKEKLSQYIATYNKLPSNFITKQEAIELGWTSGSLIPYAPYQCIGGDEYIDYDDKLANKEGRVYYECDINTLGALTRGKERLVYSNDGVIYYTNDHYDTFERIELTDKIMIWINPILVSSYTPIKRR